jgi:hypothetical protein
MNAPIPFDWWHSGRFWYCSLQTRHFKVSGCGVSKEEAIRDGLRDLLKLEGRQRLRAAHNGRGES